MAVPPAARTARIGSTPPVAVVGMACRFPDADDPAELLDGVLAGRRAFRRLPAVRVNLADYYKPDWSTPDATYSTRAALIEGWRFDCTAFGVDAATYLATDPAHWLALETAARALAAAGMPAGRGLNRERTGVILGNSLAGEVSRANALRVRWPYVRQVLTEALGGETVSASQARTVLQRAENRYLAPFPVTSNATLSGSMPGAIASGVCSYFGLHGGSHVVDSAGSSSLQAVASACAALAVGDLDVVLAGGVDVSLDPFELTGLAKAGLLATADVRIYDESPTGYLPAEGCGILVLMRTSDAVAAGLPVYAEIAGWGTSGGAAPGDADSLAASQLLAMRRAHERAAVDPAAIHLIEGNGSGCKADDEAELAALARLRQGARQPAVLGSVKANIGHAKAAAGAAGLIKTVLALGNGVLPPTTGAHKPHPLVAGGDARVEMPQVARDWPDGVRLAGVAAIGTGGSSVHLVLRNESARFRRDERPAGTAPKPGNGGRPKPAGPWQRPANGQYRITPAPEALPFLLHAHDRFALAAVLSRLADIASTLSDAQMRDLACMLGRNPDPQGRARVAIMAVRQEQLAALAREAVTLLPHLEKGKLSLRPGIFASDLADGRVTLLLSDNAATAAVAADPGNRSQALTGAVGSCLNTLRWLESLDVRAIAAVGHGVGALAGLAWAGVLGEAEVAEIAALRAQYLQSASGRDEAAALPREAADQAAFHAAIARRFRFGPPRRRLISTMTGARIASVDEAIDLICSGFPTEGSLAEAIGTGAAGSTLLVETGPGKALVAAAATVTSVPSISLLDGFNDPPSRARVAGALFAAGALGLPQALFEGMPARPIDIWRRQIFITNPCQLSDGQIAGAPPRPPARQPEPAAPDRGISELRDSFEHRIAKTAPQSDLPARQTTPGPPDLPAQETPAPVTSRQTEIADHNGNDTATPASPRPWTQSAADRRAAEQLAGHEPWVRCFVEGLRPSGLEPATQANTGWRIHAAFRSPMLRYVGEAFGENTDAARTLAVLASPADADSRATAVRAARDAITTRQLVALTTSPEFTGFFASLHAEHPSTGITMLRLPDAADAALHDAVRAAGQFARVQPGEFLELAISPDGTASEPVLAALPTGGGAAFPLDPDDVVLISRGARGAGLVLAQVMACSGNPVAVIGRALGNDDSELVAGLEELRSAGARVGYEVVDITDPPSLAAAVERIHDRLGPIRAVAHAASPGDHVPFNQLSDVQVSDYLAGEIAVLDQLVGSLRPGQLKLIVTFGSVAGRYGLPGRSLYALGAGALASRAAQLAGAPAVLAQGSAVEARGPGCRALHIDMPPWTKARLGEPPQLLADLAASGTELVEVNSAARLLLKALAMPSVPGQFALHGRVTAPALRSDRPLAAAELATAGLSGGAAFLREVVVHYPGTELVCEAILSIATDPYLADYRIDGMPVFPEVLALEALAEAASVLAGQPVRQASNVTMELPVVVPAAGEARLLICAQRDGDVITAALRCAESSFRVDHVRCQFRIGTGPAEPAPAEAAAAELAASRAVVDGAELYGPICFQSGRFRRVALLPEVTASSCRALARGTDDEPWFAASAGLGQAQFLLGSPGLADATLQVIQACVPHRRLRLARCESVTFSGRAADGVVQIRATAQPPSPAPIPPQAAGADADEANQVAGTGSRAIDRRPYRKHRRKNRAVPATGADGATAPAASSPPAAMADQLHFPGEPAEHSAEPFPAGQSWDVAAVDSTGQVLVAWHQVQLAEAGPLPRNAAWPPQLLSVFLQRCGTELGLDDALQVTVTCGQPATVAGAARPAGPLDAAVPQQAARTGAQASRPAQPGQRGSDPAPAQGPDPLAGFGLNAVASRPVTCGWTAVDMTHWPPPPPSQLAVALAQLRGRLAEPSAVLAARLQAIGSCLASAGLPGEHLRVTRTTADGWALLEAPEAAVACVVVEISGVSAPVAIALLVARPRRSQEHLTRSGPGASNAAEAVAGV